MHGFFLGMREKRKRGGDKLFPDSFAHRVSRIELPTCAVWVLICPMCMCKSLLCLAAITVELNVCLMTENHFKAWQFTFVLYPNLETTANRIHSS